MRRATKTQDSLAAATRCFDRVPLRAYNTDAYHEYTKYAGWSWQFNHGRRVAFFNVMRSVRKLVI